MGSYPSAFFGPVSTGWFAVQPFNDNQETTVGAVAGNKCYCHQYFTKFNAFFFFQELNLMENPHCRGGFMLWTIEATLLSRSIF
jgi:hypothetical protein